MVFKHLKLAILLAAAVCALVALPALAAYLGATKALPATIEIVNLVAESSLTQAKDSDDVMVVAVNIDRIKDSSSNVTATIPGGISAYTTNTSSAPAGGIELLNVRGVPLFPNPTFSPATGNFSAYSSSPQQADNTTVAKVVPRLVGDANTTCNLTVAFQVIGAASAPEMNVPEEHPNTLTFRRGDAKNDGMVDIFDAMFIAQYIVGLRPLNELGALNAAGVKYDGSDGDKIDIFDAMFIAQYIVGFRNAYFGLDDYAPWPMFLHDRQHTGRSLFGEAQSNNLKWSYDTGSWVKSSPVIGVDGTIYFTSSGMGYPGVNPEPAGLYTLNSDGTLKWKYEFASATLSSPAISPDGTIYITAYSDGTSFLHAIDTNGSLKWSFPGPYMEIVGPTIGPDGTIYSIGGTNVYAVSTNGTLKWRFDSDDPPNPFRESAPAIGPDGTVYVGNITWSEEGKLYAISSTGALKWIYYSAGTQSSPAVSSDGVVYIKDGINLYALDSAGMLKWSIKCGGYVSHPTPSPVIGLDGTIYVGGGPYAPYTNEDEYLYAINPDGSIKWRFETGREVWSSPAIGADSIIYVGSYDAYIYAITPDGQLKWKGYIEWSTVSSPAIGSDGTIYIGSYSNKLYAFGPALSTP